VVTTNKYFLWEKPFISTSPLNPSLSLLSLPQSLFLPLSNSLSPLSPLHSLSFLSLSPALIPSISPSEEEHTAAFPLQHLRRMLTTKCLEK
jgi:hypothetical protein